MLDANSLLGELCGAGGLRVSGFREFTLSRRGPGTLFNVCRKSLAFQPVSHDPIFSRFSQEKTNISKERALTGFSLSSFLVFVCNSFGKPSFHNIGQCRWIPVLGKASVDDRSVPLWRFMGAVSRADCGLRWASIPVSTMLLSVPQLCCEPFHLEANDDPSGGGSDDLAKTTITSVSDLYFYVANQNYFVLFFSFVLFLSSFSVCDWSSQGIKLPLSPDCRRSKSLLREQKS